MSDIALTVSILALVAVVGLFIGNVKFRGIGLGIGGVLFELYPLWDMHRRMIPRSPFM